MRQRVILILLFVIAGIITGAYIRSTNVYFHARTSSATIQAPAKMSHTHRTAPVSYLYYAVKDAQGFSIARAVKGSNDQPLGQPQVIASLGNGFGLSETDSVSRLELSPDGNYLAISGTSDHGDFLWMFNTQYMKVSLVPQDVFGNFLHWLPQGNRHSFLYRPMMPLGPNAPMSANGWHPGLWIVDAATGKYTNLPLGVPAADLVDAVSSPDGTRIVYSVSRGLGTGSQVWIMNDADTIRTPLSVSAQGAQSIAGLFSWSPDGKSIAYERLADSPTPFLASTVWVMDGQGRSQRRLAEADGGHGYALAWSPDSKKIAFVARTNLGDIRANTVAQSLQSAISVVDVTSARSWLVATSQQTGVQLNINPAWASNGASITFTGLNAANYVIGGTPRYWSALVSTPGAHANVVPLTSPLPHVVAAG